MVLFNLKSVTQVAWNTRQVITQHYFQNKDDEEDWQASGSSSDSDHKLRKKQNKWKASDSTGPDQDSDSDEPLFEPQYEPERKSFINMFLE